MSGYQKQNVFHYVVGKTHNGPNKDAATIDTNTWSCPPAYRKAESELANGIWHAASMDLRCLKNHFEHTCAYTNAGTLHGSLMDQCPMPININQCRIKFLTLIQNVGPMPVNTFQCFSMLINDRSDFDPALIGIDPYNGVLRKIEKYWSALLSIPYIFLLALIDIDRH